MSQRDRPTLLIDGKEVARLAPESYTEVLVAPGSYVVSLEPNPFESEVWRGRRRLNASADRSYFLAVWNDVESYRSFTVAPITGGAFIVLPSSEVRNTALRFELVAEGDALPVISNQTHVPPLLRTFEPSP